VFYEVIVLERCVSQLSLLRVVELRFGLNLLAYQFKGLKQIHRLLMSMSLVLAFMTSSSTSSGLLPIRQLQWHVTVGPAMQGTGCVLGYIYVPLPM
jgi:hypothetical protein